MRLLLAACALCAVALLPAAAHAAPVPEGAEWKQAKITSTDGVKLHADILRPKNLAPGQKTPVILSVGPYFNRSGQVGAAGPVQDAEYDPVGPSEGPSDRFHDLIEGAKLMERGYTFVMVDLRGFGGSTGCLDWGGPGEQADIVAAVRWAATELEHTSGKVGLYGKSYDGVTGLIGVAKQPEGLGAVVAQEPVYDLYRYLYGDGMRRANSLLTPALYDAIAGTPGPLGDTSYLPDSLNDPVCLAKNFADQAGDDDHGSAFWTQRNLIPAVQGSKVPLFLTQGLTENNTVADGMVDLLANHEGPQRQWLGPWEHVRGGDRDAQGRLLMGREGWYDEVMRFYDEHLRGVEPAVEDPPVAVQSNLGTWRAEAKWPPADVRTLSTPLRAGSYDDTGQSAATGDGETSGVWTVSKPLPYDVHLAGQGRVTVDVETTLPRGNLAVDVYDLGPDGKGPLITRQGHLIRESGASKLTLDLWAADWVLKAGHRIGVRVTDTNVDWWLLTVGTQQPVTVKGGSIDLPFLTQKRTETIQGAPGTQLEGYLADTVTVPAETLSSAESDFALPGPMFDPPVGGGGGTEEPDGGAGDPPGSTGDSSGAAGTEGGAATGPTGTVAPASPPRPSPSAASSGGVGAKGARPSTARRGATLTLRLRRTARGRLVASGSAATGTRVVVKLRRAGRTIAVRRAVARGGRFSVSFRVKRTVRYTATASVARGTGASAAARTS